MPKFTTPKELWARAKIDGLQSVGGPQYEGNSFTSNTLRYVKPYQGIDVECKNRYYGDGVSSEGLEQLDPTPLPIEQQTGDVVEDRDKRIELGTITESDRGFWEDINFDESTLQPFLTSNFRQTVETRLVSVPDEIGAIVYKEIPPGFSDREYSIDALPFVTDPNNDNEIIRVDKYYDKEINLNEYSLATEGKINYYLYPRDSGRFLPDFAIDTYKHKDKKKAPGTVHPSNWFDRTAEIQDDESGVVTKNKGYFVFNLDWGDGSPKEHNSKPKLLESSVMLDHHYEKPGFYTITGTVFKSNGYKIDQYERFRTNILLNPSKKYELDLFRYRNFATIGGISTSSTLVKSVSSMIGLDPFDFDANRVEDDILDEYNELDKIDILNLMNMVSASAVDKYREKYIEPYSAIIDGEPTTVLDIPQVDGCMDPNGDNYVGWATINNGCTYSFMIEGSVNGMGGQTPIFFIGEVVEADGNNPDIDKDRYLLHGGAYTDWSVVRNAISSNEIVDNVLTLTGTLVQTTDSTQWIILNPNDGSLIQQITPNMTITLSNDGESLGNFSGTVATQGNSITLFPGVDDTEMGSMVSFTIQSEAFQGSGATAFALVIAPSTIYPELSNNSIIDEPDPVAPPFGFNPSTNLLYGTLSSQGQWVWTNGGWVTNPDYQPQGVPFDGWTIPDGVRVGKINTSVSGTPIIEQISGNDSQGFGYEIDVPANLFDDSGTDQRACIIRIDPDNPPSETNYSDRVMIANWSGDTEDTGTFNPLEQLFYVPINLSVIEGDGTLVLTTSPATGQDGFVVGDNASVMFTPEANVKLLTFTYNDVQILPTDPRIGDEVGGAPLLDVYNEFGDGVNYTFNFIVEDTNNIEASFDEQVFGEESGPGVVEYNYIPIRLHPVYRMGPNFSGDPQNSTGVRYNTQVYYNESLEYSSFPLLGQTETYFIGNDAGVNTLYSGFSWYDTGYIEMDARAGHLTIVSANLPTPVDVFKGWYWKNPSAQDFDPDVHLWSNDITPQFVAGLETEPHYREVDEQKYHELWAVVESGF